MTFEERKALVNERIAAFVKETMAEAGIIAFGGMVAIQWIDGTTVGVALFPMEKRSDLLAVVDKMNIALIRGANSIKAQINTVKGS